MEHTVTLAASPAPTTQASPHDLWLRILRVLEPQVQRSYFVTWFRDTAILGREGETLIVGLPLPIALNHHLEHYAQLTLAATQSIDASIRKIVYKVDGGLKDNRDRSVDLLAHFPERKPRKLPGKQEVKLAEGVRSKIFNPRFALENFVVGAGNRLAHAACQAVSLHPGGKYNPLVLYGGVGLGKTHLLQATGIAILKRNPKATVVYMTAEDFANDVIEAMRGGKMERIRARYRTVDVFILDDVQFLVGKDRTQEEFFHTYNTLFHEDRQIVISSDRRPEEIKLHDRLISRIERGMVADIGEPDYETRLAILMQKAQEFELLLDNRVLAYVAERTKGSVRTLEGVLMQAVAQFELEHRMPTVGSIADIMQKLGCEAMQEDSVGFEKKPRRLPTFEEVLEAVSAYYSVSVSDILGPRRTREILIPRHIAMHLGKKHLRIPYLRLGSIFSGRDHTTVMHACGKMEKLLKNDVRLLREVRAIEDDLGLKDIA